MRGELLFELGEDFDRLGSGLHLNASVGFKERLGGVLGVAVHDHRPIRAGLDAEGRADGDVEEHLGSVAVFGSGVHMFFGFVGCRCDIDHNGQPPVVVKTIFDFLRAGKYYFPESRPRALLGVLPAIALLDCSQSVPRPR